MTEKCAYCDKTHNTKKVISKVPYEIMWCCRDCAMINIEYLNLTENSVNNWNATDTDWQPLICTNCKKLIKVRQVKITIKDKVTDKVIGNATIPYCKTCATTLSYTKQYNEALS